MKDAKRKVESQVKYEGGHKVNREEAAMKLKKFVALVALAVVTAAVVISFSLDVALAQEPVADDAAARESQSPEILKYKGVIVICIGILVAAGSIAAAYAVAKVGSAALGAVTERPEMMGRALIFVALAEGIAIYGLLMAILLMRELR